MKAKIAGTGGDPLAGLGTATMAPPAPEPTEPIIPQELQAPPAAASVDPAAAETQTPKRTNPGRLIGARMGEEFCNNFNEMHGELRRRLNNPNLSVNDIVAVILERAVTNDPESLNLMTADLQDHLRAKVAKKSR